jgi:UDP-N-acetylmuramoyl-tripeptide--D-alanyl-D-alanine ligase
MNFNTLLSASPSLDVKIIAIIISIFNGVLLCMTAYRSLQTLQLRGYKTEKYMHWIKNTHGRYFSRLFMLCFMSASALLVINILFDNFAEQFISYISLLIYFIYLIAFIKNDFTYKKKTPLVFTARIKRLVTLLFILNAALTYGLILLSFFLVSLNLAWLRYFFICFTPLLMPFNVLLAFIIMLPYEQLNNKNYIIRAKRKINKNKELIVIGITGSYGKTSVKNILHTMLKQKYDVLSSPASYNTPMGLTKTILKQLSENHKIFIAEMGATCRGDIKYICDFVQPHIGIITSAGSQHLESFKTLQNIKDTKYELIEALPADGLAAFNGDSAQAMELYDKCPVPKIYTKTSDDGGSFLRCENIVSQLKGIEFDLILADESVRCKCSLVGKHNISNILISAAVAYKLGLSLKEIAEAIWELQPVPHRLEIIQNKDITIIDDSFNASAEGTAAALEVLAEVAKGRKIVVTPGLVELGALQNQENYNFGSNMAKVCDICILVGENQTQPIFEGLIGGGFNKDSIITVNSLEDAKSELNKILKAGDTVLFENDLPDNYSEQ